MTPSSLSEVCRQSQQEGGWRSLSIFWPYLLLHKGRIGLICLAISAAAGLTLCVPVALRYMIDHGFSNRESSFTDPYFFIFILLVGLLAFASAARFYFVAWLSERVVSDIRKDLFRHLLSLSPSFFDFVRTGEIVSRLVVDTAQIRATIFTSVSIALRNLLLLLGAVTMMMFTSPALSALVLFVTPLVVLPIVAFGWLVRARSRYAQDMLAEAASYASEVIESIRTVQVFNASSSVTERFSFTVDRSFEASCLGIYARALLTAGVIFVVFTSVGAVFWYGAGDVFQGNMSSGVLGQFLLYAIFAAGAMGELSQVSGELFQVSGVAGRLSELLKTQPTLLLPYALRSFPMPQQGNITFDNVSFFFPTRPLDMVLKSISFTVKKGEKVAIVGMSGAGKSTLFYLLLRYYDPIEGQVLVDDVPVCEASLEEVRKCFSVVPQEGIVFSMSLRENIRFGRLDADDAAIIAAARAAFAHSFITHFPEGYDTLVGARGVTLSGGQRQRIVIARALLRDAPILLLDEATSALDSESEGFVQKALDRLMHSRTTIMIAHRLSTVKKADRILVMDKGRIVEEGTDTELTERGGLYARLARQQFCTVQGDLETDV
ncbi:MAG: ABC transporter transmembrane domain-containing protein [Alphaproteobacteria bacterium]|nr:ABC transporter transmembrane domain-containing protein [Alphaproteobacteria bacterium]